MHLRWGYFGLSQTEFMHGCHNAGRFAPTRGENLRPRLDAGRDEERLSFHFRGRDIGLQRASEGVMLGIPEHDGLAALDRHGLAAFRQ